MGYFTEASDSLGSRVGALCSPWWTFKPDHARHSVVANSAIRDSMSREDYCWCGAAGCGGAVKARAYKMPLRGQIRSSPVAYFSV